MLLVVLKLLVFNKCLHLGENLIKMLIELIILIKLFKLIQH